MDEIIINSAAPTKKIIFIFHGYGAKKDDFIPIGDIFADAVPDAEIRIPMGFFACESGSGYQWFSFAGDDISHWEAAFAEKEPILTKYIEDSLKERNLTFKDAILTGFSQGAMLSLSIGLKNQVAAVVAFAGLLLDPSACLRPSSTKVFLAHGERDEVIPISTMYLTENALKASGIDTKFVTSPNLSHGIDDIVLTPAVDFLKSL